MLQSKNLLVLLSLVPLCLASTKASSSSSSTLSSSSSVVAPLPERWLPNLIDYDVMEFKNVVVSRPPASCSVNDNMLLLEPTVLGRMPQFTTPQALAVLDYAVQVGWKHGAGVWTQMTLQQRCAAIEQFLMELEKKRQEIVETLMLEIGKNRPDAESEFDRTIDFCKQVLEVIRTDPEFMGAGWKTIGSTKAFVRRHAIGIFLALAPYNYPLNEAYAAILPCLLLGNVVVLKIPTVGGLAHLHTFEAFRKTLPPGTINFIAGGGRATMPPLMETGLIDGLAFIGGSNAADDLIKKHPHPHRLKVFLQLEANNMAIYMKDLFTNDAALDNAIEQGVTGSLSYNGQRCTALKLHFVPKQHIDTFLPKFCKAIESLRVGLPDQTIDGKPPQITPLPTPDRISYMKELIEDALEKGAKIVNKDGGKIIGGPESTLMVPAVLYPVTPDMKVYHVEQFGPVVPVTTYDTMEAVLQFGQENPFGQQVSIFGYDAKEAAPIIDRFSSVFGKINLNVQCGRSPDTLPFAGRRSSAMGVMSVSDALREFSIPTVVAYKDSKENDSLAQELEGKSNFLQSVI